MVTFGDTPTCTSSVCSVLPRMACPIRLTLPGGTSTSCQPQFSTETWVTFKTFGLTAAVFAFFLTQGRVFERHSASKDEET